MHSLWDDLLKVVLRRKRLVLAVVLLTTLVAYIGLAFKGDKYEASASLLVKLGRANADVPLTVEKGTVFRDGVKKEEINTYISLLHSRAMLEATVDKISVERFYQQPDPPESLLGQIKYRLKQVARWGKEQIQNGLILIGLKPDLDDRELAVIFLEKSLLVEHEKDTNVIHLSLGMADPFLARETLETLIDIYLRKHIEVVQKEDSADAFSAQVEADREKLGQLRASLLELRKNLDIGDIKEQQLQLARQIASLDDSIRESRRQIQHLNASRDGIMTQLDLTQDQVLSSVTIKPSPAMLKLKARLSELRIERTTASARFQPGSNELLMLDEEITGIQAAILREGLNEEGDRIMARNPLVEVLESRLAGIGLDLQGLSASVAAGDEQRKSLSERLLKLNEAEATLDVLELETRVADNRFLASSSRLEEARAQALMNRSNIANISYYSPASFSWKPVAPRRIMIMIGAIVGGLGIGLGLALFLEWQSEVLHDEKDFKSLGDVRVLGSMTVA